MLFSRGQQRGTENVDGNKTPEVFFLSSTLTHFVHCRTKSIGLKFYKSQTGSVVQYSCHHNASRFTFPIFAHSWRFSVLPFITINHTAYILTEDNNTFP